ncbi:PREDICTED: putative PRAME family member 24-like [Chrysochloris asiatica]|uniref:PRAME family member 24-like n=1 Tax=Chrysochloris asiatica TaxID=185453 RepID=A0A9B0U852_CHRAS|nr:PREDICTED: putative PRAME family member 24-like [Chrysochloris asiatica]
MNRFSPPVLLNLAIRGLQWDETLAVAAVKFLPKELFGPLFSEAMAGRHSHTVKAMMRAWPFPWLHLGYFLDTLHPHHDILKIALDGLDLLLTPNVRHRRCKLRVLDLRQDIATNIGERVNERKGLPRLCCRKLVFPGVLPQKEVIDKILRMVQLEDVQEVSVDCSWDLQDLTWFAPHLGRMLNLSRLCLSGIAVNCRSSGKEEEVGKLADQFSTLFLNLPQLQHLHLECVLFLNGYLPQLFSCMQTPLATLKITDCFLLESDMAWLSFCPSTQHLKCLDLSGVPMKSFNPKLLSALLETASSTLERLNLGGCEIRNSHITRLLSALGQCSQLTDFTLYGNHVSMVVLEHLLRYTAQCCKFRRLELPVPLDCYLGNPGSLHRPTLQWYITKLGQMLQYLLLPSWVWFGHSSQDPIKGYDTIFIQFVSSDFQPNLCL